jgi:hypothetical protein
MGALEERQVTVLPTAAARQAAAVATSDRRSRPRPVSPDLSSDVLPACLPIALANGNADVKQLLQLVARGAASLVNVERCVIYLRNDTTELFEGQCAYGSSSVANEIRASVCGQEFDGLTREIVATRHAVLVTDARHDSRPVRATMLAWGIRSVLGVPIVNGGDVIGLIFVDDGPRPHAYGQHEIELLELFATVVSGAIVRARETEQLRVEARVLSEKNHALQMAEAFGERLSCVVGEGGGLGELTALVARFTGMACAMYDRDGFRKAAATPPGVPAERYVEFARSLDAMPELAEAVASAAPGRATVLAPPPCDGRTRRLVVLRPSQPTTRIGAILLDPAGARVQLSDGKILRRAAAAADLLIRTEISESQSLHALVGDLLLGHDNGQPFARAAHHGVSLSEPHVVCVFAGDGAPAAQLGAAEVAGAYTSVTGSAPRLIAEVGGDVAVLMALDRERYLPEELARLRSLVADVAGRLVGCRAALSRPCTAAGDYAYALDEARRGLSSEQRLDSRASAGSSEPLGAEHLLTAGLDPAHAVRFVRGVMAPLLEDESSASRLLITTLDTFFECSRSIRDTAQRLDVHENTVRYRLASVLKRTGLDVVSDPRDEFAARLALQLMRSWPGERAADGAEELQLSSALEASPAA